MKLGLPIHIRGRGAGTAILLGLWLGAASSALASAPVPEPLPSFSREPFSKVWSRLMKAEQAIVSSACGTAIAPWGYRGRRGEGLAIKAYRRDLLDPVGSRQLVAELLHEEDWAEAEKFRGRNKPCLETHDVPLFTVTWKNGRDETYALISFEHRCAVFFEAEHPLGSVRFDARAEAVFERIRRALPDDSLVQAMTLPPPARPQSDDSLLPDHEGWTRLPSTTHSPPPIYPLAKVANDSERTVHVHALVGADGSIQDAFVTRKASDVKGVVDAALQAVWQWKFKPAAFHGKPVPVWVRIPIRFRSD